MALPPCSSLLSRLLRSGALGLAVSLSPAALCPLGLLAGTPAALAQEAPEPATVAELTAAVEAAYKGVSSMKADFTQVSRSAAMGEGEKQRGRIQLMRPRSMRWDFTHPDPKLFVTDGKTMWVYTPAEKQVIISQDLGGGDGGVDQLLTTLESLDELFEVTLVDRQGGIEKRSYVLELVPRKEGAFKSLRLELSRRKYELEKLVIVDAFDNETEMTFSNLKLNPTIAAAEFSFTVPSGIQVVRADGL